MAQRRRQERMMKAQQRKWTILCIAGGLGAVLLSLTICLLVFDMPVEEQPASEQLPAVLPYDANTPFTLSDLTSEQLLSIRENGRISVSDGPRGVSIGDTLEELLERFPSTITKKPDPEAQTSMQSDEEMTLYYDEYLENQNSGEQTGIQSNEEMILYCADYFANQNGVMTALPPRGLLTVDNGFLVVTLLAPTAAYPEGTADNYGQFEHIYCVFTIEPDTSTISQIILGIDQ